MLKKKQENKGITLVALVVTIVVLIILAGVSIATLTGENGLLTQASRAKQENEKAGIIEEIKLDIAAKQADNLGNINEDEFYEILGKYGTISSDETTLTTTKGNYEILISDIYSGNIESSLVTTPLESWEYEISGTNIVLKKYIGNNEKIAIPQKFVLNNIEYNTKLYWTSIAQNLGPFINNKIIQEVKFDDNIQVWAAKGDGLFYECSNLQKVKNLPNGYTSFSYTFAECGKLQSIDKIPEGAISLNRTFYKCKSMKTAPTIPSTVTSMEKTFEFCDNLNGNVTILSNNISNVVDCFNHTPSLDSNINNKIFIQVDLNSLSYEKFNEQIQNWNHVYFYGTQVTDIACWGDSLTAGAGGNGTSYPSVLTTLCGKNANVYQLGVGGESTSTIAGRQGGIPMIVSNFEIPETKTSVQINLISKDGNTVAPAIQNTLGLNKCYICNVEGDISYSNGKWYFTRSTEGDTVKVPNNTEVITDGMLRYRDSLMILWSGSNDQSQGTEINVQNLIEKQRKMLNYSNDKDNYIIIGLTAKYIFQDNLDNINTTLSNEYKEHFIDLRTYLLDKTYLTNNWNLSLTEQDLQNIDNGEIPVSLRSDNIHFNAKGYEIIANLVYQKLNSLGYITE